MMGTSAWLTNRARNVFRGAGSVLKRLMTLEFAKERGAGHEDHVRHGVTAIVPNCTASSKI